MWSKISSVLKSRQTIEEPAPSSSDGDVMSRVKEHHPSLSSLHGDSDHPIRPSPPSSPSRSIRRGMFRRMSRGPLKDDDSVRAPSPMTLPIGLPKKVKSSLRINGNNSQTSLVRGSSETSRASSEVDHTSKDILRPSNEPSQWSQGHVTNTLRATTFRRPSLDMLRNQDNLEFVPSSTDNLLENDKDMRPVTPLADARSGSIRSILRDPKTPGTGQNVRFFPRDAYKAVTPDDSMDAEFHSLMSKNGIQSAEVSPAERHTGLENNSSSSVLTRASQGKASRPTVAEIFSPMSNDATPPATHDLGEFGSLDHTPPLPAPDFMNIFDSLADHVDLPNKPPGLGFDVEEPPLDSSMDMDISRTEDAAVGFAGSHKFTSTPWRDKGKAKATEKPLEEEKENIPIPTPIDESIFHGKEKPPRFPSMIDRSQSFSFGQTVFHSMPDTASPDISAIFSSVVLKPSLLDNDSQSQKPTSPPRNRGRAVSDTVFQSMIRSAPKLPEADINDDSCNDLVVVYSGGTGATGPPEPDPFRANATTYYTPQTMIPTTPPQGAPRHARKTSKEESIIFSLQTQLALQTELCQQYEVDLRARDETVGILEKKLAETEKDEVKRRNALRTWKKKVQELEKTCRYLEEEVEGSRHESMERSVMDEASGEALRMLHRQIAVLEQEKKEWSKKEEVLREEVETLEGLVKDRSEDVMNLKESLWSRDESERELKKGIKEAKEQIEQMGNVSVGLIDEEEIKKLMAEMQQKSDEEKERHRLAESEWEQKRTDFLAKVQQLDAEKVVLEHKLGDVKQQLKTRDDENAVLKTELEAQWTHTEEATGKIESLEKKIVEVEEERDAIKRDLEELEQKTANMEVEWTDSENKKAELEAEVQEVWNYKEALEKERDQLQDELQEERNRSGSLSGALRERESHAESLEQDRQNAIDSIARIEERLRQRDEELAAYSQRIADREAEAEHLQEEISSLRREHSHIVDEQSKALQDVSLREGEARSQLEALIRRNAESDAEIDTLKDKVTALKDEVERLRRQVHELQQESADKEVKIVQLTKQRAQDKEDMQGINIALDSKQQELELLKRRMGVRGTAGSTPAHASRTSHQREPSAPSAFATPSTARPSSRPSSAMSDVSATSKGRKLSTETLSSAAKVSALGKSTRANSAGAGTAATPLTMSRSSTRAVEGSMGPPPAKPRVSASSTPTPMGRASSYSRFPVTKSAAPAPPVPQRLSSLEQPQSKPRLSKQGVKASPTLTGSASKQEEKENISIA